MAYGGSVRRRVALAGGIAFSFFAAVLVFVLAQDVPRSLGTNSTVRVSGVAVQVPAGRERCQAETVPVGTRRIKVFAAAQPRGGPLQVSVGAGGGAITGESDIVEGDEQLSIRLSQRVGRELSDARVCFKNVGSTTVQLAGDRTPPAGAANPDRARLDDDARIDYSAGGRSSRLSFAGPVAERLPLFKASFFGTWTVWALLGAVCASWVLTGVALRRSARP